MAKRLTLSLPYLDTPHSRQPWFWSRFPMTGHSPLAVATLSSLLLASAALAVGSRPDDQPAAQSSTQGGAPGGAPSGVSDDNKAQIAQLAARVEEQYVIGPSAAGDLGYRILWQARLPIIKGAGLRHTHLSDDAIFVVDTNNSIARLRANDGEQIWRVAVANPVDAFRGIDWIMTPTTTGVGRLARVDVDPRVYVSTDTECFVLDGASGSITGRQGFAKLPTTAPLKSGKFLIYGTLGGQVVWHHAIVGSEWRANALDSTVRGSLARARGVIVAASDQGLVMALDESSARQRWSRRTFDSVLASPAIHAGRVFVASLDQYLWCLNLSDGSVAWKHFTQTPLKTSPFPVGDVVLQYVPGEGLVCFNIESDNVDGTVRWRNADAVGAPMGQVTTGGGDRIVLWDQPSHTLTLIDPAYGSASGKHILPAVVELEIVSEGPFAGEIFATAEDGRVLRLTPKFRKETDPTEAERAPAAE
jgi:outer membrane protein assembly factor BamB